MADTYDVKRPWLEEEFPNTSMWLSRGWRDNTDGNDTVRFHAFIPRGSSPREIVRAANALVRIAKRFRAAAQKRGFARQYRGGPAPDWADGPVSAFIYPTDTPLGDMELRVSLYFKIGVYDAMEVP